nr:conotoxin precursor Cver02 [Conus ebraeus]UMA82625.1 conotoxin precursor Cver02 [Conus ebraeus]UMA82942.1 conotoxin precursor Cver02 [Conus ebraeus]DAZ86304.1 TPA_inf: conotoxin precursor Cver02 [Conus ebraeus]
MPGRMIVLLAVLLLADLSTSLQDHGEKLLRGKVKVEERESCRTNHNDDCPSGQYCCGLPQESHGVCGRRC